MDDALSTIKALALGEMHRALNPLPPPESKSLRTGTSIINTNGVNRHIDVLKKSEEGIQTSRTEQEFSILNGNGMTDGESQHESPGQEHVEVATAPLQSSPEVSNLPLKYQLFVWSAKDEAALKRMLRQYTEYWNTHVCGSQNHMERLAYTLAARRSVMAWRSFAVIGTNTLDPQNDPYTLPASKGMRISRERGLAFVFTGQGAQYVRMGLELLQYPVFESTLTKLAGIFHGLGADWSLFGRL